MTGRVLSRLLAAGLAMAAAGCAQTTRVDEAVTPTELATKKTAVAIMRLGSHSPTCRNVSVVLGTRDQSGFYKRVTAVNVIDVRSVTEPPIAEVELDAGEYHVIAFVCGTARGTKAVSGRADFDTYRISYASFSLARGEIVNVGFLRMNASHVGRSAFGRPVRVDVSVTDWPLDEIERYKARRPELYQKLTTRLMTITPRGPRPPGEEDCGRILALKAEGKIANVPASCQPSRTAKR